MCKSLHVKQGRSEGKRREKKKRMSEGIENRGEQ